MGDWVNLERRQAGLPPETELAEGVPDHVFGPLLHWVDPLSLKRHSQHKSWWDQVQLKTGVSLLSADLITKADFLLYWYPRSPHLLPRLTWGARVAELDRLLATGRSVWRVNARRDGLERRTEKTVTAAARQIVAAAPPAAQDHLQAAWTAVYGRHPNPDLAYDEVIRAVEDVICPLIQPKLTKSGNATLGTAIGELRHNAFHKWELGLPGPDGKPRDIAHLIGMMELLWQSQVSRHAGAPKSRRQHHAEAQAAVHLAVNLVHWLTTGVLRTKG